MTENEIHDMLLLIPHWTLSYVNGYNRLERTFPFNNYGSALKFAREIGLEADNQDHHPRITIEWKQVKIEWWTHNINGLHRNDFIMASKTDEAFQVQCRG